MKASVLLRGMQQKLTTGFTSFEGFIQTKSLTHIHCTYCFAIVKLLFLENKGSPAMELFYSSKITFYFFFKVPNKKERNNLHGFQHLLSSGLTYLSFG